MKPFLSCAILFVVICNVLGIEDTIHTQWQQYKVKHGKSYSISEDIKRKEIFAENLQKITAHNKLYEEGKKTFKLGVNSLADVSDEEYKLRLGFRPKYRVSAKKQSDMVYNDTMIITNYRVPSDTSLPEDLDWRTVGAVTKVKDQGACGSCWAFSAIGALEAQHYLKPGNHLTPLSEKNLIDCSHESINFGCQGGDMIGAFEYVHNNDGLQDEDSYPYVAQNGYCSYNASYNVTSTTNEVEMVEAGDERALRFLVSFFGPVAIAIDAGHTSFQLYDSGIYYEPDCTSGEEDPLDLLNHGVLLVGYGVEDGQDYWIVKNSWGLNWGEGGYVKMARGKDNNCGIASYASVPLAYDDWPFPARKLKL